MDIARILLEVLLGLFLIASLIPLFREQVWWLRAWTYARLQIFCISVFLAIIYGAFFGIDGLRGGLYFAASVLIIALCLRDILPFTRLWPKQVRQCLAAEPGQTISLIAANVLMENEEADRLLDEIRTHDPDIVFLVETDQAWADRLSELETRYEHSCLLPLEDFNGMLLYSRLPISNPKVRYLVQEHIPSITADIALGPDSSVRFYGLHPRPPRPQDDTADLDNELQFVANEVGHCLDPVIVTGDMNDVGWSSTTRQFLRLSGLLDPRKGRGLFNSYSAKLWFIRWPLDHIFHSRDFTLVEMKRLPAFGSDHFPIYIKLNLIPEQVG